MWPHKRKYDYNWARETFSYFCPEEALEKIVSICNLRA